MIYAVKNNLNLKRVSWETAIEDIISRQLLDVQSSIAKKLSKVDFDLSAPGIQPNETLSVNSIPKQILRNITTPKIFEPPDVLGVDENNKKITIPDGFYSNEDRLKNGGFFIEEGFEVLHKHKGDSGIFTEEDRKELAKLTYTLGDTKKSFSPIINQLINDSLFGELLFGYNSVSGKSAYKTVFATQSAQDVRSLSVNSGKISRKKAGTYSTVLNNPDIFLDALTTSANAKNTIKEKLLQVGGPNKFFKQYNYYKTLNLLIPTYG